MKNFKIQIFFCFINLLLNSAFTFAALVDTSQNSHTVRDEKAHLVIPIQAKININTAGILELAHSFKGIGTKRALSIIEYREKHGKFKSLDEIGEVKGISHKFVTAHMQELLKTYTLG